MDQEGFPPVDVSKAIEFQLKPKGNPKLQMMKGTVTIRGSPTTYYYRQNTFDHLRDAALSKKTAIFDADRGLSSPLKEDPLIDLVRTSIRSINEEFKNPRFQCYLHIKPKKKKARIKIAGELVELKLNGEIDVIAVDLEDTNRKFSIECKNWAEPIDSITFNSPEQDFLKNIERRELGFIPIFVVRRAHYRVQRQIKTEHAYLIETEFQFYAPSTYKRVGRAMKKDLGYYFILPTDSPYAPPKQLIKGLETILLNGK